jgi:hypothetical protein
MPVITFLSDLFSLTKGAKYRLVGRHTQRYSLRIADRSRNHPVQQRIMLIALAGADEWVSDCLKNSSPQEKPSKIQVLSAMRSYLSAVLILLGTHKDVLLQKLEYDEAQWMNLWCQVFEYQADDMSRFDSVFLDAYRNGGFEALIEAVQSSKDSATPGSMETENRSQNTDSLRNSLAKDLAAIARIMNLDKECEVE